MSDISEILGGLYLNELDTGNFDDGDWLHAVGDHAGALLYSILFTPEVLVLNDCVFFTPFLGSRERLEKQLVGARSAAEKCRIEWSWNYVELPYLFNSVVLAEEQEEHLELLAQKLASAWNAWLGSQFPGEEFQFRLYCDEYELRFWKERGCKMPYAEF